MVWHAAHDNSLGSLFTGTTTKVGKQAWQIGWYYGISTGLYVECYVYIQLSVAICHFVSVAPMGLY